MSWITLWELNNHLNVTVLWNASLVSSETEPACSLLCSNWNFSRPLMCWSFLRKTFECFTQVLLPARYSEKFPQWPCVLKHQGQSYFSAMSISCPCRASASSNPHELTEKDVESTFLWMLLFTTYFFSSVKDKFWNFGKQICCKTHN